MIIVVNGLQQTLNATTIEQLLDEMKIDPKGLAVAVNDSIVPRAKWGETKTYDNIRVSLIRATQGG